MFRESKDKYSKHDVVVSHYRFEDCTGCPRRAECCKASDTDKPKELRIRKQYLEKRSISEANISTEEGILLRIHRGHRTQWGQADGGKRAGDPLSGAASRL